MTNNKSLQKKLKGADVFQKTFANLFSWIHAQRFVFGALLGATALVVAGVLGWQFFLQRSTLSRVEKVGEIESVYLAEEKKAQDEIEKLRKQISEKVALQKQKLESQIAKTKADHKGSLGKFQDYFKNNPKYPQGWMAGLRASSILAQEKKYADAKTQLQELLKVSGKSDFYQTQGRFLLIGILEEMKQHDDALKEVDALLKVTDKDKELKPLVLFTKGRLQLSKNQKKEASATFAQLIKDFPESPEADKSRSLQLLFDRAN